MLGNVTIWGAFLAGLLSFVSPCVLPLVPPYLGFIAGVSLEELTGKDDHKSASRRVFLASLAFVAGFTTVFVALGASASFLGQFVTQHIQFLGYIAGAAIIVMGLHFLGVFRIAFLYREARVHVERKPTGLLGAYVIGLAFAFGWTPCVGPVLAAILFMAGAQDSVSEGRRLLFVYALGMTAPFVLAAMFIRPFLRWMKGFRRHLGKIEKAMGILLIVFGILIATNMMNWIANAMLAFWPSIG